GDVFIGGGVESMTRAPYVQLKAEGPWDRGPREMADTTLGWRFTNPKLAAMHYPYSMGETGENVAEQCGVSRERQDAFALESHRRAVAAVQSGRFADQVVPINVPQKKGEPVVVDRDEHPRADTSIEALGRLRPADHDAGPRVAADRWPLRPRDNVHRGRPGDRHDRGAHRRLTPGARARRIGLGTLARACAVACLAAGPNPSVGYRAHRRALKS